MYSSEEEQTACTDLPGGPDKLNRGKQQGVERGDRGKEDCGQMGKVIKCHDLIWRVSKAILREF